MMRLFPGFRLLLAFRGWALLFGLLLPAGACQRSTEAEDPREVVITYQNYLDQNQFEQAKQLSTPAEASRLEDIRQMLLDLPPDTTRLRTRFLSTDCQTGRDTAYCICRMADQEATYRMPFRLLRMGDAWKMDTPVE